MIFAWDDTNRDHLMVHGVSVEEAEQIVYRASDPYPEDIGDGKFVVWGQTESGRYLQVILVFKVPDDVLYESLSMEDWLEIERGRIPDIVRVIHAMELTSAMKRRLKKRWR
jgi:uncharacterized DUF497 family protein